MIYRIEKLNNREIKEYEEEITQYKKTYKEIYGRSLPKNTLIFRRISVLGEKLDNNIAAAIIRLHTKLFGVRIKNYKIDNGDLIMYCDFTRENKTIKLQKGDINKMREEIKRLTKKKTLSTRIKRLFVPNV